MSESNVPEQEAAVDTPAEGVYKFSQAELQEAASMEENERLQGENRRLVSRVVLLRALTTRLETELKELRSSWTPPADEPEEDVT